MYTYTYVHISEVGLAAARSLLSLALKDCEVPPMCAYIYIYMLYVYV